MEKIDKKQEPLPSQKIKQDKQKLEQKMQSVMKALKQRKSR